MLGAIRGVLLGERKDRKRRAGTARGPHLFKGKRRGNRSGGVVFRGQRKKFISFIEKLWECRCNRVLDWTLRQIISCKEEEAGGIKVWKPESGGGKDQAGCGTVSKRKGRLRNKQNNDSFASWALS